MTAQQIATHIFVSHSSADAAFVQRLAADLQRVGVPIWVDHQKLKPGTRNWEKVIREALKKSRALIYVASPTAAQSNYVQDELSIAEMEGCTLLATWAVGEDKRWLDCTPLGYGKLQNTDMRAEKYESGLKELLSALSNVPVKTINLTPIPVAVVEPEAIRSNPIAQRSELSMPVERVPEAAITPRNPYKALDAFTEADAQDFFGRAALIAALLNRLSDFPSFLTVIGASGSGKSSVVMAGLLPALRQQHPDWIILPPVKPGAHPVEALAIILRNAYFLQASVRTIREDLDAPNSRGLIVQAASIPHAAKARIVLLADQFEELFTQTVSEQEREQFINILTSAATDPSSIVTVIVTLRADFFDRPLSDSELGKLIQEHSESVLPMSITDLKQTIEKPAEGAGLSFEDGLVSDMVFDARDRIGGLPLLQFTLEQLFQRRDGLRLTRQAYQEMGGVKGALARRAEETYTALTTDDHHRLTRALFLRLIEPGAMEQDMTRRRAALRELDLPNPGQTKVIQECANAFVNARLLTTNETVGLKTIEVSHEALIREWKRLGEWLREARDDIRLQQTISQDAAAWQRHGRRPDDLYRGQKLTEAQSWAARNVISTEEMAFLEASIAGQQAQEQAEWERQARELELAKQAAENARRAEAAEKDRAVRFEQAARTATRRAQIAGLVALFAVAGIILAVIAAVTATGQITNANNQLGTATVAQGQAQAAANDSGTRIAAVNVTLTPVSAGLATATGAAFDNMRFSTFVPRLGGFPPTPSQPLNVEQKYATATAIATAYQWTPEPTQDAKGIEMVLVPPGCYLMGDASVGASPVSEICFAKPFWIDRYLVTNEQFDSLGDKIAASSHWTGPKRPRENITWFEASAFCVKRGARLPTEAEWEYAARGPASRVYPWGDEYVAANAVNITSSTSQTADVGPDQRPNGASWVGAFDMVGNVWEWTSTIYDTQKFPYPYNANDGRESSDGIGSQRVLRGGTWNYYTFDLRSAARNGGQPYIGYGIIGFRCVRP